MAVSKKMLRWLIPFVRKILVGYYEIFKPSLLKNALTVFVYHDISKKPCEFSRQFHLNVTPEVFDFQVNTIRENFELISPAALLNLSDLPPKSALITFDDGLKSVFNTALPLLDRYKIPSLVFLNMAPVKGDVFWSGLITYLCNQPEFIKYLKASGIYYDSVPLFLKCSNRLVECYQPMTDDLRKKIENFVGEFASMEDLHEASESKFFFFGNHLYNHHVPIMMSDKEFIESYLRNEEEIKQFPNYVNMFAFPFGQPGTCFEPKHIDMLKEIGTKRIFSSSDWANYDPASIYLDRISLYNHHDTEEKIKFQILKHRAYKKK